MEGGRERERGGGGIPHVLMCTCAADSYQGPGGVY